MKYYLAFAIAVCCFASIVCEKVINCYFGTWSVYRPGKGKFEPDNIDPKLCTHLSYSFFGINDNGEFKMLDSYLDTDKGSMAKTIALKEQNPKLKVLAVVGGWNENPPKYSKMAADPSKRANFISSSLKFIEKHGFDGLDLDWEYPTQRGGSSQDRQNFVLLLKELKAAFKPKNLVLGIAVSANKDTAAEAYDIPNISKYVDFINVMTYDFNGSWSPLLGMNAPLRGNGGINVESAIKYWLAKGAPANKLLLGIGSYGRSFTTAGKSLPGSPARGAGKPGKYTRESGTLGYNEICEYLKTWKVQRDAETAVPYAYNGNEWVGYDDAESIRLKMDFLKSMNLGGAMIWSIDTDDFQGTCGKRYPLLRAINNAINGGSSDDSGSTDDSGNSTESNNGVDNNGLDNNEVDNSDQSADNEKEKPNSEGNSSKCEHGLIFKNHDDCSRFYMCSNGIKYDFLCAEGTYFDELIGVCNHISEVKCNI